MAHSTEGDGMADLTASGAPPLLTTSDGVPLKTALARAQSKSRRRAFLLVMPLLLFVMLTFIAPIGQMLHRAIYNDGFAANMPELSAWFAANPIGADYDEAAYAALAADLASSAAAKTIGVVGTRVNYEMSGTRSLFTSTGRKMKSMEAPFEEALIEADAKWADPELWGTMRQVARAYSPNFFLAAVDLTHDASGSIVRVAPERQVYVMLFVRTFI